MILKKLKESELVTKLIRISELVEKYPKRKLQTLVHYINAENLKIAHKEM